MKNRIDTDRADYHGDSPLIVAIQRNDERMVKYLVSKGADVNFRGDQGFTPLLTACLYGFTEILKILVDSRG